MFVEIHVAVEDIIGRERQRDAVDRRREDLDPVEAGTAVRRERMEPERRMTLIKMLTAYRLWIALRIEEHVALSEEPFCAALIEDGLGIYEG